MTKQLTDLSGNEIRVYQYLREGKKKARSREWLCQKTGLPDRAVRYAINCLRAKGYPVCSTTQSPGGYWLCDDTEDLVSFIAHLKSQRDKFSKTIKRLEALLKNWGKNK